MLDLSLFRSNPRCRYGVAVLLAAVLQNGLDHMVAKWMAAQILGLLRCEPTDCHGFRPTPMGVFGRDLGRLVVPERFRIQPYIQRNNPNSTGAILSFVAIAPHDMVVRPVF